MIHKLLKLIFTMAMLTMLTISCNEYLDDINTDTNTPTNIDPGMRLTYAQNLIFGFAANGNNRSGSLFAQYLSNGDGRSSVDVYDFTGGGDGFYLYNDGLIDLHKMYKEIAKKETSYAHYVGVGKVLEALALGTLTDAMGDVPYSEALNGSDNIYPSLDHQEKIYQTIQTLLSDAILELTKESYKLTGDFIFSNNAGKWIIFAHLLKARYYNHLSKHDPEGSATLALSEIDKAIAAGWNTNFNVEMPYMGNTDHQNPNVPWQKDATVNASYYFVDELKNNSDPRIYAYFTPLPIKIQADAAKRTPEAKQILLYRPELSGISKDTTVVDILSEKIGDPVTIAIYASAIGPVYSDRDASLPVFLAAEVKFIEAEAALRKNLKQRAASALNEAVKASMNHSIPQLKSRLTSYKDKFPGNKNVEAGINAIIADADGDMQQYIDVFASETEMSVTLSKVMIEKYKAMYWQGVESWTDLRRHDFVYPGYLESPRTDEKFIRRFPYPEVQKELNKAQFPDDNMLTRLWWDK